MDNSQTTKFLENAAVAVCVAASCSISFYAQEANFLLLFAAFTASAVVLSWTTFQAKQYAVMRLQMFFVVINVAAFVHQLPLTQS